MCGRFVRSFTVDELIEELNVAVPSLIVSHHMREDLEPDFNVPPSVQVPVLSVSGSSAIIEQMRWGFGIGESSQLVINARAESVTQKPMFRHLLAANRCAVPMNGFFEWKREAQRKSAFYVQREDLRTMWVAGLWRPLSDGSKQVVLLTHEAEGILREVHHRSPCQLSIEDAVDWTIDDAPHLEMLTPSSGPSLQLHQVSSAVNSIRNNDSSLIDSVNEDDDRDAQLGLFD